MISKILNRFTIAGLVAASAALSAHAGGESSSGGGAMVCRDDKGKIVSAQLLDLWEVQFRADRAQVVRSDEEVDTQIEQAISRVAKHLGKQAALDLRQLVRFVRFVALDVGTKVELSPPSDALNDMNEVGCKLEGAALFNDRKNLAYVSHALIDAMPKTDQAALWIHEAIYKARRDILGDKNSVATRDYVGWLFSSAYKPSDLKIDSYLLCNGRVADARLGKIAPSLLHIEATSVLFNPGNGWVISSRPTASFGQLVDLVPMKKQAKISDDVGELLNLVDRKISDSELRSVQFNDSSEISHYFKNFQNGFVAYDDYVTHLFGIATGGATLENGLTMTVRGDQELFADIERKPDLSRTLFTYKIKYTGPFWNPKERVVDLTRNEAVQPLCKRHYTTDEYPLP